MSYQLNKDKIIDILKANENLSHIKDVDSLLDHVLYEARTITNADAGSIYLKKGEKLSFEYVQNDTLMKKDSSSNKHIYKKQEIPINNESIAGYAALNKTDVMIDDVYQLGRNVPYTFNRSFDESSSYHTQSILTVPLMTTREKLIGVMQIINAKDERGRVLPFSQYDKHLVALFANQAASAIERAQMTREIILRMIKIAEMRDPEETGPHVNRVGAICIEIYQRWAARNRVQSSEIKKVKDILRISAMLHDVGKVAISDAILKKKSRLSNKEREIMKFHTVYGARLFKESDSDWDDMAAEIALNHHEKWNGTGYPGYIRDIYNDTISIGPGKKGHEIPLPARIVALADVYDALMSNRSYKNPWPEEKVIDFISAEKHKHFDPELVDTFMEIYDIIKAIREKYSH
ncbi:MAG: HD domain-containing protein [Candidatus Aminicenantes bacterium]|nr:HD domain-containing protein [Candidatus Aminicenantes bacterium]NIM81718.1 HD domain-containing protein [Candidatus Aminicenantes bacterium]NIN21089.1 HD domain-containing protein [Candidatus Aminicenantes bacterium]NIN44911.1 HD domain-containing protein [Candidatus Aminicenantes bacterium]NIN87725.1 HD domain-containing protein [Candidatus Aminicenantes bacterium]